MLRFKVYIYCLVISFFAFSQDFEQKAPDSLTIARINKQLEKADAFYKTNLDSALFYIEKTVTNLKPYYAPELEAKTLLYKSRYLLYKKEYGTIIQVLGPNLKNTNLISLETLGRTYKDIGHAYKQEWLPDSALVYYIKALKTFEKTENNRDISLTYLAIGLVYAKIGNKKLAKTFYDKSIKFSTNSEIMNVHKDQLINQEEPISHNKALEFSLDILKIAENRDDERLMAVTYSEIKKDYFRLKDYNKALEYADKELAIRNQTRFNSTLPNTKFFIGNIYLIKKNYNQAIVNFEEAIPNATDSLKLSIYQGLKTAHLGLGNSNKALQSMEKYNDVKDSINDRNTKASIAEITSQYQDERQKQEIKALSFQNEANAEKISNQRLTLFTTIVGSILLLLLAYFGYKNYKSKQDLNYTQLNFKLLQTQLNPHFMFNALNEIKLNLNENKTKESSEYLMSYSKLMRHILEGSNEDFVTLEEDVNFISKFLQLQQLVNSHSFDYRVEVHDDIDTHFMEIPPMLTQPFVENAVLHGVKNIENGCIEVLYKLIGNHIEINIIDNGKGYTSDKEHSGKQLHKSLGTDIILQRIKNYNKLYNFKIEVATLSHNNSGTIVKIKIPVQLKRL